MTSDLALIERIKQRDARALGELYDRYATRVYSLALAIAQDEMSAQEIAQDVFLKVWSRPERYTFDDNRFGAWLLMIARHAAIDHLRREKRRLSDALSIDDGNFPELPDLDHDSNARWRELQSVMQALPHEQRLVIILAFYHGLSQSEISDQLGLPLGTVKTRLRLGMQKLRVVMKSSE
jgi:RNA polymerase sigma-70 factor (ECF subfamily)